MIQPFGNKYGIEPSVIGVRAATDYLRKRNHEKEDRSMFWCALLIVAVMLITIVMGA